MHNLPSTNVESEPNQAKDVPNLSSSPPESCGQPENTRNNNSTETAQTKPAPPSISSTELPLEIPKKDGSVHYLDTELDVDDSSGSFPSFLLSQLDLYDYLDFSSIKELSSASKQTLKMVISHITSHFYFALSENEANLQIYKKYRISFERSVQMLQNHVTHIKFGLKRSSKTLGVLGDFVKFKSLTSLTHLNAIVIGSADYLPTSLTHLRLVFVDDPFYVNFDNLPPFLTHLKISAKTHPSKHNVNRKPLDHLPGTLIYLTIDGMPASLYHLPNSLKYLHAKLHSDLDHLPPAITHLSIYNSKFKSTLSYLPLSVTHLFVENYLLQSSYPFLDDLPNSITHLLITCYFKPIDHLPATLTHLEISVPEYECSVDNLPQSLTHFSFCATKFSHSVDHLPPSLTYLYLNVRSLKNLDNLPVSLKYLLIGNNSSRQICTDHLPDSLTHLIVSRFVTLDNVDNLPKYLKFLLLDYRPSLSFNYLPSSLSVLMLDSMPAEKLDNIPINCEVVPCKHAKIDKIERLFSFCFPTNNGW